MAVPGNLHQPLLLKASAKTPRHESHPAGAGDVPTQDAVPRTAADPLGCAGNQA